MSSWAENRGDPADLYARLSRLEDQSAITAVLYAYGTSLDYGDLEQFLGCFTTDAGYYVEMRIAGGTALEFHGHDDLTGYFESHSHAPAAWHKHVTTNPAITVDGDSASVTSYFLRVDAGVEAGPATVLASGRYLDTFARTEGGWRIAERRCRVENL